MRRDSRNPIWQMFGRVLHQAIARYTRDRGLGATQDTMLYPAMSGARGDEGWSMVTFKRFAALCLLMGASFVAHAGTVTYVYTDPQGTPLAEANASGTITATFDYRPYGSQALGSPKAGPGYTGHVNDPDTGFVYMQARYYDAVVGRFLSTDPDLPRTSDFVNFNRYAYARNNPAINTDPTGKESPCVEQPNGCDRRVAEAQSSAVMGYIADGLKWADTQLVAPSIGMSPVTAEPMEGISAALEYVSSALSDMARVTDVVKPLSEVSDVPKPVTIMMSPKSLVSRQLRSEMTGSQVKRLASDMRQNGFDAAHPIDAAQANGRTIIIDGHHRAAAAVRAGINEVPVNVHPVTDQQAQQLMQEATEAAADRGN